MSAFHVRGCLASGMCKSRWPVGARECCRDSLHSSRASTLCHCGSFLCRPCGSRALHAGETLCSLKCSGSVCRCTLSYCRVPSSHMPSCDHKTILLGNIQLTKPISLCSLHSPVLSLCPTWQYSPLSHVVLLSHGLSISSPTHIDLPFLTTRHFLLWHSSFTVHDSPGSFCTTNSALLWSNRDSMGLATIIGSPGFFFSHLQVVGSHAYSTS